MKKLIAITIMGMAMTVAQADTDADKRKSQNLGISGGMVIGAVAGGPFGAMVGAAIGSHYANKVHESGKVPTLEEELQAALTENESSQQRLASLNRSLFETRGELGKLSAEVSDLLLERAAFEGLQMEVLYQTGESKLTDSAAARLTRLAELLKKLPDMTVRLDGYADARGDENFNDTLSRARAESVRNALVDAGIEMNRIAIHAHGETGSAADSDNLDAYALDRKVQVRLFGTTDGARVAQED